VSGSSCSIVTDKKKQGLLCAFILGIFGGIKEKRKQISLDFFIPVIE
jgi:hypothetical protein